MHISDALQRMADRLLLVEPGAITSSDELVSCFADVSSDEERTALRRDILELIAPAVSSAEVLRSVNAVLRQHMLLGGEEARSLLKLVLVKLSRDKTDNINFV